MKPKPSAEKPLGEFEKRIGIHFKDKTLLEEALTHKSYAMERGGLAFNERLEFLGDSILNASITDYLFHRFPNDPEGKLSKLKSQWVAKPPLYKWAKEIRLGHYLKLSESEISTGGKDRESNLANAMESVIGAIFLDKGFEVARKFIIDKYSQKKRIVETDHKSRLQELIQKQYHFPPTYEMISDLGPDHNKTFEMEVRVKKKVLGKGNGKSKKEAEQAAAYDALKKFRKDKLALSQI